MKPEVNLCPEPGGARALPPPIRAARAGLPSALILLALLAGSTLAPNQTAGAFVADASPGPTSPAPTASGPSAALPYTLDEENLNGSRIALVRPPGVWNRCLLILARGWRPAQAPLVADLHPDRPLVRYLLASGWAVATTSYRRTDASALEAVADLEALRARAAEQLGDPDRILVEGEGFGGLVAVLVAERGGDAWSGSLAIDPALETPDRDSGGTSLQPHIPLLLMATRTGLRAARAYVEATLPRPSPTILPALLTVARDGDGAVSEAERKEGVRALESWVDDGRTALPAPAPNAPYFDATLRSYPGPSTAVFTPGQMGCATRVADASWADGHIDLEAQPQDLEDAGISLRTYFRIETPGQSLRVRYGLERTDVRPGQWVLLADADGRTRLELRLGSGSQAAGFKKGQTLHLVPYLGDPAAGGASPGGSDAPDSSTPGTQP